MRRRGVRLGLIGCGAWGWRYVPSALEAGNCEVVCVARADHAPTEALPFLCGLKHFDDWRGMLAEPLDAFVVAAPPSVRVEIVAELLHHGRPVMVEKPFALRLPEALAIERAAPRGGPPLLVACQHLFAPAYEELRERSAGWPVLDAVSRGGGKGPVREYSPLWDYGPHDAAMILGLGLPGERFSVLRSDRRGRARYDFEVRGMHVAASVSVWNDGPKARSFEVVGPEGDRLVYDDLAPAKLRQNGVAVLVDETRPVTRAVRAFARAASSGETDWRFGAWLGVESTRMLAAADSRRSGETRLALCASAMKAR